ncbi:hypothetical protein RAH41_07385 [Gottfriedia acidiceleris]|uniref:hypothetical protein n=1 Tax=Gottfriedia acidiceleris TaxID=371036 RepID=UPI002F26B087
MAIGDLIFQLIVFLIPVAIIILVFIFIRKNRLQMQRIEAKLDKINENLKKD